MKNGDGGRVELTRKELEHLRRNIALTREALNVVDGHARVLLDGLPDQRPAVPTIARKDAAGQGPIEQLRIKLKRMGDASAHLSRRSATIASCCARVGRGRRRPDVQDATQTLSPGNF